MANSSLREYNIDISILGNCLSATIYSLYKIINDYYTIL